jgi:hypothetical protein
MRAELIFSVDVTVLRVLLELTKLPSATKAWRLQVGEAFNDQRFFKVKLSLATLWKPLISGLMDSDKERFGELLGELCSPVWNQLIIRPDHCWSFV